MIGTVNKCGCIHPHGGRSGQVEYLRLLFSRGNIPYQSAFVVLGDEIGVVIVRVGSDEACSFEVRITVVLFEGFKR